jgi:hypothetical protein
MHQKHTQPQPPQSQIHRAASAADCLGTLGFPFSELAGGALFNCCMASFLAALFSRRLAFLGALSSIDAGAAASPVIALGTDGFGLMETPIIFNLFCSAPKSLKMNGNEYQ